MPTRVSLDTEKTLELIERMKQAKIGEYKKWEKIIQKIKNGKEISQLESEYFASLARIYKKGTISKRSKIFHFRLSEQDTKPPCQSCGEKSSYYCNMNDAYFCEIHVVGHDENEI